jgi:hypothetical protein
MLFEGESDGMGRDEASTLTGNCSYGLQAGDYSAVYFL